MSVREFWLTNADGTKFSLMPHTNFLYEPQGLGYGVSLTTTKLGNTDVILSEMYNLGSVEGELLFMDNALGSKYQRYQEFLQFLSRKPIQLHYLPPNATDAYYCAIRVVSVEKTEVNHEDNVLHCPIQMYRQTMWFNETPTVMEVGNTVTDGKSYPLDRPYAYGQNSLSNIALYNSGMADAAMKLEIVGSCTNPQWELYDDESVQYGACKITGTYDYVMINSDESNETIYLERGGSVIPNAANYQDLTVGSPQQVYVTFLKLKPGSSRLVFIPDENFSGYVRITWRNSYVSV